MSHADHVRAMQGAQSRIHALHRDLEAMRVRLRRMERMTMEDGMLVRISSRQHLGFTLECRKWGTNWPHRFRARVVDCDEHIPWVYADTLPEILCKLKDQP